jgi:hypothetical protein
VADLRVIKSRLRHPNIYWDLCRKTVQSGVVILLILVF